MRQTAYQDATRDSQPTLGDLIDVCDILIQTPGVERDTRLEHIVLKAFEPGKPEVRGAYMARARPAVPSKPGRVGVKVAWTS
jgi:hypothetical protein